MLLSPYIVNVWSRIPIPAGNGVGLGGRGVVAEEKNNKEELFKINK